MVASKFFIPGFFFISLYKLILKQVVDVVMPRSFAIQEKSFVPLWKILLCFQSVFIFCITFVTSIFNHILSLLIKFCIIEFLPASTIRLIVFSLTSFSFCYQNSGSMIKIKVIT